MRIGGYVRILDQETRKTVEEGVETNVLIEEVTSIKHNKMLFAQEFEVNIEHRKLKERIESLNKVNEKLSKTSSEMERDITRMRGEIGELMKEMENLKQIEQKEEMDSSMNSMLNDNIEEDLKLEMNIPNENLRATEVEHENTQEVDETKNKALSGADEQIKVAGEFENEMKERPRKDLKESQNQFHEIKEEEDNPGKGIVKNKEDILEKVVIESKTSNPGKK